MDNWTKIDDALPNKSGKYEVTIEYEDGIRENIYAYWVQCESGFGGWANFQHYPGIDYSKNIRIIAWKPFSLPYSG